jgi:hypothetical protein
MTSRKKSTIARSENFLEQSIPAVLKNVCVEIKTGTPYTLTPEAQSKIAQLVMMVMKRLCCNIQELVTSAGPSKDGKNKEITIDTVYKSLQLTFPVSRTTALYDKKGTKVREPIGAIDTLEAYIEAFLRARLHAWNRQLKSPVLDSSDFMKNNQAFLSQRNALLFLQTSLTPPVTGTSSS